MKLGVGSSSALSFRFDLRSVRLVERETLQQNDLFALAPPTGGSTYGNEAVQKKLVADLDDTTIAAAEEAEKTKEQPVAMTGQSAPYAAPYGGMGAGGGGEHEQARRHTSPHGAAHPAGGDEAGARRASSAWRARSSPRQTTSSSRASPRPATETRTPRASRAPTRCAISSFETASTRARSSRSVAASRADETAACASSRRRSKISMGKDKRRLEATATAAPKRRRRRRRPIRSARRTSSRAA